VREVRLSSRLKESAACLVSEEGALGPNLERLLQKMGRGDMVGQADERILELNPEHPAVRALQRIHQKDASDPRVEAYAHLLHDQALLAEGGRIQDPVALARRINELIAKDQA
jgi:molecular chaperone HtpG